MLRSVSMIASARCHSPWFSMCIRLASSAASIAMSPSRFVDEDVTVAPGRSRLRPGFCVYMFYSAVQEACPSKYYCSGKAGARTAYVRFGWIIIDWGGCFLCYCYLHSGSRYYLELGKGLCRCFRRDQHLVDGGLKTGSNGPFVTKCGHCRSQRDKPYWVIPNKGTRGRIAFFPNRNLYKPAAETVPPRGRRSQH